MEDRSGPAAEEQMRAYLTGLGRPCHIDRSVLPDDGDAIREAFLHSVDQGDDILLTTGGTGIGPRDLTPDVIRPLLNKEIPGIMEHIRIKYGAAKPHALLSRSIAGVAGSTLVYVLPGSVKAVNEYMEEILKTLKHLIYMLHGLDMH